MKTVEIKGKKYKVTDKSPKYRAEMVRILIDGGMLVRGPYYVRFSEGDPVPFISGLVDSENTDPVSDLYPDRILENPGCFKVLKEIDWPDLMKANGAPVICKDVYGSFCFVYRVYDESFIVVNVNAIKATLKREIVFEKYFPLNDDEINSLKIGYKGDRNEN